MTQKDVLFIHGWWSDDWVWSRIVKQFQFAGYRTHTLSLSGPDSGPSTFSAHLDHALAEAKAIGNPIIVGHSAGGLLALKMMETLNVPACIAITPAAPAGLLPRPSCLLIKFIAAAMPSLLFGRPFFPRDLLRKIDLHLLSQTEQDEVLDKMRPVSAAQVRMIVPGLIRVAPRRIKLPLLIVGSLQDRLTPVTLTRAIARRYGADYREYPKAAHYILREPSWQAMTSDIINWIDSRTAAVSDLPPKLPAV